MNSLMQERAITVDIDGITTIYDVYMLILEELVEVVGLEGAVLSNSEGLPIASVLGRGVEENYISALSANALTFIEKIAEEVNNGGAVEQMIIKISNSLVIISGIGDEAILTVLANKRTNMGILMTEMAKARERLSGLLLGEVVPLLAEADEKAIRA